MGSKRSTDTDVQPTGSQVTHSRARSRSGLLAFLRPRQTVSPGAQNAPPDQATASRVNILSPGCMQPDTSCTLVFDSNWSNLPDHLIESVLHVLQSSESDPLHPSNRSARLVRAQVPSACTAYQQRSQLPPFVAVSLRRYLGVQKLAPHWQTRLLSKPLG